MKKRIIFALLLAAAVPVFLLSACSPQSDEPSPIPVDTAVVLSELSADEKTQFLKENGVEVLPDDSLPEGFAERIVSYVENDPTLTIVGNDPEKTALAKRIKAAVNKHYGIPDTSSPDGLPAEERIALSELSMDEQRVFMMCSGFDWTLSYGFDELTIAEIEEDAYFPLTFSNPVLVEMYERLKFAVDEYYGRDSGDYEYILYHPDI